MTVRMTGPAMRQMYESGYGVMRILEYTGMSYIDVHTRLVEAGTALITGGPHDTERCRHEHWLSEKHANGSCVHPAGSKHTVKSRKASANA